VEEKSLTEDERDEKDMIYLTEHMGDDLFA
jgi:hypothetical protein